MRNDSHFRDMGFQRVPPLTWGVYGSYPLETADWDETLPISWVPLKTYLAKISWTCEFSFWRNLATNIAPVAWGRKYRGGELFSKDFIRVQWIIFCKYPITRQHHRHRFGSSRTSFEKVMNFQSFRYLPLRVYGSYPRISSDKFLTTRFVIRRVDLGG